MLTPKTIRFGAVADEVISEAAAAEGVSFSQYVREAALVRAVVEGRRRESGAAWESTRTMDDLARARAIIAMAGGEGNGEGEDAGPGDVGPAS